MNTVYTPLFHVNMYYGDGLLSNKVLLHCVADKIASRMRGYYSNTVSLKKIVILIFNRSFFEDICFPEYKANRN